MPFELLNSFRSELSDASIAQIGETNRLIAVLEKRKVDFIAIPNLPDAKNKEHLCHIYNVLMQAHLRRFLCLIDSMELTWNSGQLLPCTIMGRSCMECAAIAIFVNYKLEKHISDKAYNKAFYWIASHTMLMRKVIDTKGFDALKFKSIHIMDAIRSVDIFAKGYADAYEWISEFLHPNSFGVFASFCNYRPYDGRVTFLDSQEISRKTLSNCLSGLLSVPVFASAWSKVEDIGKEIVATDWSGDDDLAKLFRPDMPTEN